MTGQDIWRIIRKRKWMIILSTLIISILVALITVFWYVKFPFYTAGALLRVQPEKETELTQANTLVSREIIDRIKMSHAQLIKSLAVIQNAAKDRELRGTKWFTKNEKKIERSLMDDISVSPVANTNFIRIAMTGIHKKELPIIINAVARSYMEFNQKISKNARTNEIMAIQDERNAMERDLREIAREARENRPKEIPNLEDQRNVLNIRLGAMTTELLEKRDDMREVTSQLESLKKQEAAGTLAQSPMIMQRVESDPILQQIRQFKMQLEMEVKNIERKYGPDHRMYKNQVTRLESVSEEFEAKRDEIIEINKISIVGGMEQALEITTDNLVKYQEEYDEQVTKLHDLQANLSIFRALENKQRALEGSMKRVDDRLLELRLLQRSEHNVELASQATVPIQPSMPKFIIMIPMGVFLGVGFGFGLTFLLELMDTSVSNPTDVSRKVDLPMLGMVPHLDDVDEDIEEICLAFRSGEDSIIGEAFRQIHTCLLFSGPAEQRRSLLVTSPLPEDGRTAVAMNLADATAKCGRKTLLVDCNFHQPAIGRLLENNSQEGLSNALVGQANWQDMTIEVQPNMNVLLTGPLPPNPAELLGSEQMRKIVAEMTNQYDQVIFDGPPCLVVTDPIAVSTLVDGVVMVIRAGVNTYGICQRARSVFSRVGAHMIGAVLNGVRITSGGYLRKNYDTFYEYREQPQLQPQAEVVSEA